MHFQERKKISTDVNLTPLIDIVFLLLIFFMVTANFIDENATKIELPKTEIKADELPQSEIIISIDKDGKYYIDKSETTKENLVFILRAKLDTSSIKSVIVEGDANSKLQEILFLMESAKKSGATSLSIKSEIE